ncbi:MAG: hypothetical protein FWG68_00330, partial [Defluviitaleaceae bacterium]|nr:hypothetical protein [Defluviitaleaceae bacterium]
LIAIASFFMFGYWAWIAPHLPAAINDFMGLIGWWYFFQIPIILLSAAKVNFTDSAIGLGKIW